MMAHRANTATISVAEFFSSDNSLTIQEIHLRPYRIKLQRPWPGATSKLNWREGFLVQLILNNNTSAIGECAPMVEIGTESLSQAQHFLESLKHSLPASYPEIITGTHRRNYPASCFALETASLSLLTQQGSLPFYQQLNSNYSPIIKTNIMLGALEDDILTRAIQAESDGYRCLKVKMGLKDIRLETEVLCHLLSKLTPDTLIRLDANKSWTMKQTQWLLNRLQQIDLEQRIDSLEEPLRQYSTDNYQLLQARTRISLALDESFKAVPDFHNYPVRRLVLKPMAQGGVFNVWQLAQEAKQYKIETVVTSSIETAYGLWPITYLCAALNNDQFHGLATAHWLEDSLIEAPEIQHGLITL